MLNDRHLLRANQKLDGINANLEGVDDRVRHYLAQIDQLALVSKSTAEVDVHFPNLAPIRHLYSKKADPKATHGEAADILAPLRQSMAHDSASGSDTRRMVSRQNSSVTASRKKASLGPLPQIYALGVKPWPRRTALSPNGSEWVNPIRRVELTLEHAHQQHVRLQTRRDEALSALQRMITAIDAMIKQKDAVRHWTKAVLESTRSLRNTADGIKADLNGDLTRRLKRLSDTSLDRLVRSFVGPLLQLALGGVGWSRWVVSRRNEEARRSFRRSGGRVGWAGWICWGIVLLLAAGIGVSLWYGEKEKMEEL